jgi:hypothetical protein
VLRRILVGKMTLSGLLQMKCCALIDSIWNLVLGVLSRYIDRSLNRSSLHSIPSSPDPFD